MPSSLARDIRTIPNIITLSRIGLLVVAAGLYFASHRGVAILLAVGAGVTDYLDGAIARATGQVTRLGEILDQFCDLCYESLVLTVAIHAGFFPPWVILIYLLREFWVLAIRRYTAEKGVNIASSLAGKLKTNFVMWGFLPTFLSLGGVWPEAEPHLARAGKVMVGVGLLWSYISGWGYTRAFLAAYEKK
jgi:CDP-diacylglycerol--glycerol-3-phosphate 3-phosphatidyltransferase